MAKDKAATEAHHTDHPTDETAHWIQIQDHRPMYNPNECEMMPIRGYLLGTLQLNPSNENLKPNVPIEEQMWTGLVMKLTVPCMLRSPEGDVRMHDAGTECIIGVADQASVYGRANHATLAFEVMLTPIKEMALGGGRKMWLFEKKVNPVPADRTKHHLEFLEGDAAERLADPHAGTHRALPHHATA
jgi:hypothetical protein